MANPGSAHSLSAAPLAGGTPPPPAAAVQPMDAAFIERNQIVERYLAGKLPARGAVDFERWCRENPQLVDGLGLADRVNAALRLMEASGRPAPWEEKPRRFYERPLAFFAALGAAVVLAVIAGVMSSRASEAERQSGVLAKRVDERPLLPVTSTRPVVVEPSRTGPSQRAATMLVMGSGEMVDLKIDVSWSRYTNYRVTMDRTDQGRVAVLGNLQRDSNGQLRLSLNSSAFGPGNYQLTLEGLDWRGNPEPTAWVTLAVVR